MGASLARRPERLGEGSHHSLRVGKDFIVPEAQNAPALALQLGVTLLVFTRASMLAAIGFDHQMRFNASEVDNVWCDGELAPKSPTQPVFAECFPQHLFSVCHVPAQLTRAFFLSKTRHAYLLGWAA